MTTRRLTMLLAVLAALLVLSWSARTFLAHMRCDGLGMIYVPDKGCVEPNRPPPVILERGLTRT